MILIFSTFCFPLFHWIVQTSHDEAVKQRDALVNEAASLKMDLQKVREDRDRLVLEVENLTAEVIQYKESTESSCSELDNLRTKSNELEVANAVLFICSLCVDF